MPRQASTNPEHWSATEDYMMNIVKYRTREPGLRPRRTKLEIPGWAGGREPRADGSHEYVWHCLPFSEGAQYGIELFYPYENELHVTTRDSKLIFDGDFGPPPENGLQWPPFRTFGEKFYTYQILLDLRVVEGLAIRTEPHPRFYAELEQYRSYCCTSVAAQLVDHDVFYRVQIASRRHNPHLQAGRALRTGHRSA